MLLKNKKNSAILAQVQKNSETLHYKMRELSRPINYFQFYSN